MNARVLVTGGGGFVGRHAVDALRARGATVVAPTRRELNALDAAAVDRWLREQAPTHVLHLAWCTEPGRYQTTTENVEWLRGGLALAGAFFENGGQRFVGVGTCLEYEVRGAAPLDESTSATRPATLYGSCKLALGQVVAKLAHGHEASAAWARLFYLYGPNEDARRLVPTIARSIIAGEPAELTPGQQERDYLHAADAGDALAALTLSRVEGPVNVASGDPVCVADLAGELADLAGRRDLLRLGARSASPAEPAHVVASVARLRDEVGWQPRATRQERLRETLEWWRGMRPRVTT